MASDMNASAASGGPDGAETRLGERMRSQRRALGYSLQQVSERAGISVGHLSQIERALSSPSVRELAQIASVLGTGIGDLLDLGEARQAGDAIVTRPAQRGITPFGEALLKQRLTPPGASGVSMFLVILEPGGMSGTEAYTHGGCDAGLVLQGRLLLVVDGREHLLDEGDSFHFPGGRPHRFANALAGVTRVIWINGPEADPSPG